MELLETNGASNNNGANGVEVGKCYFFRTVTNYLIGRVEKIVGQSIWFEKGTASWIASTGRFHNFLVTGEAEEVEPIPMEWAVNFGAISDFGVWPHAIHSKQK